MKNIENLLNEVLTIEEGNKLQQIYKDIFVSGCSEYGSIEEVAEAIDSGNFSCINGCIGELVYYSQTEEIFKNHFNEIFELAEEFKENTGLNLDIELTANNLVWFTFEYMIYNYFISQIEEMIQEQE